MAGAEFRVEETEGTGETGETGETRRARDWYKSLACCGVFCFIFFLSTCREKGTDNSDILLGPGRLS